MPEEIGYTKVYNSLVNGGVFARFANHPFRCKNEPELSKAIDEIYEQYYYSYYDKAPAAPSEYTEDDAKLRADIALKYGFKDVTYKLFHRIREFNAQEYLQLLPAGPLVAAVVQHHARAVRLLRVHARVDLRTGHEGEELGDVAVLVVRVVDVRAPFLDLANSNSSSPRSKTAPSTT